MGDLPALLSDVTWTCQQLEQIRHKQVKDHELLTKSFEKTLISILKQEHAILNQLAAEHEQLRDQLSSVMKINKVALQDGLAEISSLIEEISEISAQLRQIVHTSDTSEAVIKEMKEKVHKIFSKETIINITLRKVYFTPQPLGRNTIGEVRYEKQTLGFTIPVPPKEGPASRVRCENPVVQRDDHASLENTCETSSHPENVSVKMSKHESDLDSTMPGPRAPSQREKKATIPYKQKISLSPMGYRSPSAQENRVLVVKKRPCDQRISCKNGITRGKTSKEGGKDKECKFSETKTSRLFIRSSPLKRCLSITRDNNLNSPGNPHILASDSHETKNKESSNKKKRDEEELESRRDDADRDPKGVQEMGYSGNQVIESADIETQAGRQSQTNNIREDPTLLPSVEFQNNQLIENSQLTDDKVTLIVNYLTLDKMQKRPSCSSLRSVSPPDSVSPKCTFITEHAQDRKRDGKYRASCRFFQPRGKSNKTADKRSDEALFRPPRSVSPAASVSSMRTFIIERSKGKETSIESHATHPLSKSTTPYKKELPVISPPAERCETRAQHQMPKSMGLSHAKTLPKNVLNARNQLPQTRSSWKPVPKSTSTTCIEKTSRPTSSPSGPFRSASSTDGKASISGSSDYQSTPKRLSSTPSNVSLAFHMREKPSWSRKKSGRVSH